MNSIFENPYATDDDRHQIWNILIKNDFEGFVNQSWSMLADDFLRDAFFGIDMQKSKNPSDWKLTFPTLDSYKQQWISDCMEFQSYNFDCDLRERFYEIAKLEFFDFQDEKVLVHKIFDGDLPLKDSPSIPMKWRSLFLLKKVKSSWFIVGFCGYIYDE